MFRNKLRAMSCALLAIASGAVAARGEIVTFEFAGSVEVIEDPGNLLADQLVVGAPAFASLRYDTATPDLFPGNRGFGVYSSEGWLKFDVGGLRFEQSTSVSVKILDGGEFLESFSASATGGMTEWPTPLEHGEFPRLEIEFLRNIRPFTMLDSDALPTEIRFSEASQSTFTVSHTGPNVPFSYTLRLSMVPVPEPATWALLGLGLAALGWRARRR